MHIEIANIPSFFSDHLTLNVWEQCCMNIMWCHLIWSHIHLKLSRAHGRAQITHFTIPSVQFHLIWFYFDLALAGSVGRLSCLVSTLALYVLVTLLRQKIENYLFTLASYLSTLVSLIICYSFFAETHDWVPQQMKVFFQLVHIKGVALCSSPSGIHDLCLNHFSPFIITKFLYVLI